MSRIRPHYRQDVSSFEIFHLGDAVYAVEYNISGQFYPATREEPEEYPELEIRGIKILDEAGIEVDLSADEYSDIESNITDAIWYREENRSKDYDV